MNETNIIAVENVCTTKRVFIETWIQEMKPVFKSDKGGRVWESENFWEGVSYQDFVQAVLWCIEQNQRFFSSLILYKCFLDWVQDGGIRTCSGWAIQVRKWSEIKKSSTSWNFRTVKTPMQGTQHGSSLIKNLSKSGVFSMPTPTEEIKPVILVSYTFGFGGEKEIKCFPWKFLTIRILMLERKTMIVQLNTLLQVFCFRLKFWWRKSNCWWLRSKSLKIGRNQKE